MSDNNSCFPSPDPAEEVIPDVVAEPPADTAVTFRYSADGVRLPNDAGEPNLPTSATDGTWSDFYTYEPLPYDGESAILPGHGRCPCCRAPQRVGVWISEDGSLVPADSDLFRR